MFSHSANWNCAFHSGNLIIAKQWGGRRAGKDELRFNPSMKMSEVPCVFVFFFSSSPRSTGKSVGWDLVLHNRCRIKTTGLEVTKFQMLSSFKRQPSNGHVAMSVRR